ncbi:hypothetical protein [Streptomyces glycanivorans]|uniref:Uncharacterized protein n=1 Tax=Streptomyces glycanivorans TaxID=3033808 RepID=A0ABY9JRQ9_9ACTN|nr:hypothetical protein [Streptomyces sp. Alt3]WLQ69328.1 hypothetical protein P8A20_38085 [Streptomyces sp. Alt3]
MDATAVKRPDAVWRSAVRPGRGAGGAARLLEQLGAEGKVANLARYIKTGEVTARDTGE